ncbi:MAG: helix-turn-helix domain-containing protein [Phycisphaerae bacterium]|jgi:hypothetical protein
MNRQPHQPSQYELLTYDGNEMSTAVIPHAELDRIDTTALDHFHSRSLGVFGFRAASGDWVEHHGRWPLIGPKALAILEAIQLNPGIYLDPRTIAQITGFESLYNGATLATRILKLREAHKEKGRPRFFKTIRAGGYRVCWPKERTWMWLEMIPASVAVSA